MSKEQMHGGHRERMREKYISGGLEVLADHEVIELLLYYPIRRRNVNHDAHELLKDWPLRSLRGLSEEKLFGRPGIGERTALFLSLAGAAAGRYASGRIEKGIKIGTYGASSSIAKRLLGEEKEERWIMMCLNAQCRLQGMVTLARGEIGEESINGRQLMDAAMRYQTHSVILANNHIDGDPKPRKREIEVTQHIVNLLASIDIIVWDQILISGESMLGLKKSGYFDGIEEREDPKPEMMAADAGKYKKDKGNNEVREKEVVYDPYGEERSYE